MTFPVKLVHPAAPKKKPINARDEQELANLQRLGWQVKES